MPADKKPIIVIKKISGHGGHHGGAWKVAYADFVTAMMALFIVLWLLNTSDHTRKVIAGYFAILSDIFLRMIKMIIAPLLFSTLVVGIAGTGDMKAMGRIALKAILYFELVTTVALFLGHACLAHRAEAAIKQRFRGGGARRLALAILRNLAQLLDRNRRVAAGLRPDLA